MPLEINRVDVFKPVYFQSAKSSKNNSVNHESEKQTAPDTKSPVGEVEKESLQFSKSGDISHSLTENSFPDINLTLRKMQRSFVELMKKPDGQKGNNQF